MRATPSSRSSSSVSAKAARLTRSSRASAASASTAAAFYAGKLFVARRCHVAVELAPGRNRGRTVIDRWDRGGLDPNATVLETLDADGFFDLLGDRLASLP